MHARTLYITLMVGADGRCLDPQGPGGRKSARSEISASGDRGRRLSCMMLLRRRVFRSFRIIDLHFPKAATEPPSRLMPLELPRASEPNSSLAHSYHIHKNQLCIRPRKMHSHGIKISCNNQRLKVRTCICCCPSMVLECENLCTLISCDETYPSVHIYSELEM